MEDLKNLWNFPTSHPNNLFSVVLGTYHQEVSDLPSILPIIFKQLKLMSDKSHASIIAAYDAQACAFLRLVMGGRNSVFNDLPLLSTPPELVEYNDEAFRRLEKVPNSWKDY